MAPVWPGRRSIGFAVGGLVVAATLWWFTAREPLPAVGAGGGERASAAAPVSATRAASVARAAGLPPPVAPHPRGGLPGQSTGSVYPPTSRPLSSEQLELLQPNRRHETVRPDDQGAGITYLFTADRYFVIGDETLTATLDVRRGGKPIPVTVTQAYAVVIDPSSRDPQPIALSFAPSGSIFAAVFAPAGLGLARQSTIAVYIEFDHGAGRQGAHLEFQYTPARGIPARFTGAFSDAIEAGSLVIRASVAIDTPGRYLIDCNLFDEADRPVAWTHFKGELAAGVHDAELMFFGKIIRDGNARGPFHIGQLRGARLAPGLDPALEQMPPFAGTYTTRAYPTDAFSDAAYDPDPPRVDERPGHDGGGK